MSRSEAGFTLLEVLVALAILSIAVVASIQGFAQGLRLLKLTGEHQHATQLADEKVREIVKVEEGQHEGQEERGGVTYSWQTTTTPVETAELTKAVNAETAPAWKVYRITVVVKWAENRQVELATLRTVPANQETFVVPPDALGRTPPEGTPTAPQAGGRPRTAPTFPTSPGSPNVTRPR
jgi:type II secretion system protein I